MTGPGVPAKPIEAGNQNGRGWHFGSGSWLRSTSRVAWDPWPGGMDQGNLGAIAEAGNQHPPEPRNILLRMGLGAPGACEMSRRVIIAVQLSNCLRKALNR